MRNELLLIATPSEHMQHCIAKYFVLFMVKLSIFIEENAKINRKKSLIVQHSNITAFNTYFMFAFLNSLFACMSVCDFTCSEAIHRRE